MRSNAQGKALQQALKRQIQFEGMPIYKAGRRYIGKFSKELNNIGRFSNQEGQNRDLATSVQFEFDYRHVGVFNQLDEIYYQGRKYIIFDVFEHNLNGVYTRVFCLADPD